jgi:ribosome-binding factor A
MTPDLSTAYIDVSVLGDRQEQREAAFKRLEALTPEIRRALAGRVRHQFKRMPELKFFLDETPQHTARLDELFAQIRVERGDAPAPADAPADEDAAG